MPGTAPEPFPKIELHVHLEGTVRPDTLRAIGKRNDYTLPDDLEEYRQHRGRMEVEAESVAYIVAGLAGFDTSAYSIGYITGWADEDVQLIRTTASRVLEAAHAITEFICA